MLLTGPAQRHDKTFRLLGVTPVRLVDLMGHRDKKMIFGVYGYYRHGLVEERRAIIDYPGRDFLEPELFGGFVTV
jgi:hypothetical protein